MARPARAMAERKGDRVPLSMSPRLQRIAMQKPDTNLDASHTAMREHFLGWQCRLRQLSVRQGGGRPTTGMRPSVSLSDEDQARAAITVLIVKREPEQATAEFRHMVQRTQDPAERYSSALRALSAAYYQRPAEFSEEMTALFNTDGEIAARLLQAGSCVLDFEQYSQRYRLACTVRPLPDKDPAFQATYWHNRLFNPHIPAEISVLAFMPDWATARAEPAIA